MKDNKLNKISDILFEQLQRLNNQETMKDNASKEIARSGAMSKLTSSIISSAQTGMKIMEISKKTGQEADAIVKSLGLENKNE